MRSGILIGLVTFLLSCLLAGCPGRSQELTEKAEVEHRGAVAGGGAERQGLAWDEEELAPVETSQEPPPEPDLLSQRSIYFELDSDILSTKYQQVVEAHAAHLANQSGVIITLEGHADERGTREYNLALGDRRAQSIKRVMVLLGLNPSQARTVSHGEERPYANGHDEEAWRLNRRVDLVY